MARPLKEGLDYFPHDTDAFNDEKIEALRMRYGAIGYMFYFFHLERIYRSPKAEIVSDAETQQIFARKLEITHQEYNNILETCLKYHCFDQQKYRENGILTSNGIQKRANTVYDKRKKMKYLYNKIVSDAETTPETKQKSSRNASESTQSKVKKSKVKKSKENNIKEKKLYKECVYLADDEYEKLIGQYGEAGANQRIQNLNDGIMSKGYKYKSHYHTILTWERKNNGQTGRGEQPITFKKDAEPGKYSNIPVEVIETDSNDKGITRYI